MKTKIQNDSSINLELYTKQTDHAYDMHLHVQVTNLKLLRKAGEKIVGTVTLSRFNFSNV